VLVGDAGHHKDFVIGDGITQALRDARNLAAVLRESGRDEALRRTGVNETGRLSPSFVPLSNRRI
jgi:2-polyprenyl-6-methoxyphenol hydroxylase-like FAD-dependent oxidoreductase